MPVLKPRLRLHGEEWPGYYFEAGSFSFSPRHPGMNCNRSAWSDGLDTVVHYYTPSALKKKKLHSGFSSIILYSRTPIRICTHFDIVDAIKIINY